MMVNYRITSFFFDFLERSKMYLRPIELFIFFLH